MSERFPARRSRGGDAVAPVAGLLLFLALAALVLGASREPAPGMLLLVVVAVILATAGGFLLVWAIAYQRLAYQLTDTALRVDWLGRTAVVPYTAIQGIYTGQRLSGHSTPPMPRWPGISVGLLRVRGVGRLRFFATSADQSLLTLITVENGGLVLSARDPHAFRTALIERVEQFGDAPSTQTTLQTKPAIATPWTLLADPWLPACIGLGVLALLIVLALIDVRYPELPDQVVLHFDAGGQPSQIAPKSDLLRLPLFGFVCLAINALVGGLIHERERLVARLLWLGGAVVQVVLLIGVLRLVA